MTKQRLAQTAVLAGLVALPALGAVSLVWSARPAPALSIPGPSPLTIEAVDRYQTGHQRADRLAFDDQAHTLAVTCPRYNRLVLLQVTQPAKAPAKLTLIRDIELAGRPVAVAHAWNRFFVLMRPAGDARHLQPAFWQAYDAQGAPLADPYPVGYDPDDIALDPAHDRAYVLLSGHAEGETNRPPPALSALDMTDPDHPRQLDQYVFEREGLDPSRVAKSPDDPAKLIVSFAGTTQLEHFSAAADGLRHLDSAPGSPPIALDQLPIPAIPGAFLSLNERKSSIDVIGRGTSISFPLRGSWGLARVEPVGLGLAGNWLAAADRAGGVHLLRIRYGD